jgi:mycothiol synthase
MSSTHIMTAAELRPALRVLLAPPGSAVCAPNAAIAAFTEYIRRCELEWRGWRSGSVAQPEAILLTLLLPGRAAILMLPPLDHAGIDPNAQRRLIAQSLAALADRNLYYVQVLIEPTAHAERSMLHDVGFRDLTTLEYLERNVDGPAGFEAPPIPVRWTSYAPAVHGEFAKTILATYAESLDCPELTRLRPIDDIVASHRASGLYDPQLWELAWIDGQPAGCLLLAPIPAASMLEVVYMGVTPACRGRAVGLLLLQRALAHARSRRIRTLTLVVDERNQPARRVYGRAHFVPVAERAALLHRLQG